MIEREEVLWLRVSHDQVLEARCEVGKCGGKEAAIPVSLRGFTPIIRTEIELGRNTK